MKTWWKGAGKEWRAVNCSEYERGRNEHGNIFVGHYEYLAGVNRPGREAQLSLRFNPEFKHS
jgi:hypothetical protein